MSQWEYLPTFITAEVKSKEMREFLADHMDNKKKRPPRYTPESMIPELNKLGDQGWELLHMEPVTGVGNKGDVLFDGIGVRWSNTYFCVFKRMKPGSGVPTQITTQQPVQQPPQQPVQPSPEPQPGGDD